MLKILFCVFFVLSSAKGFAALSPRNPNGQPFGDLESPQPIRGTDATRCHSQEWAQDFIDHIQNRLAEEDNYQARVAMQSIRLGMESEAEFCQPPMTTDDGTMLFMLSMAEAFFVHESSCNPEITNPHAPNGTAIGFGQMGVEDAQNHQCRTADGARITQVSQLQDGPTNARCVAQIMMNCAAGLPNRSGSMRERRHYGSIARGNRGQFGFVGCFW